MTTLLSKLYPVVVWSTNLAIRLELGRNQVTTAHKLRVLVCAVSYGVLCITPDIYIVTNESGEQFAVKFHRC